MGRSDFLFAEPSFIEGVARIFDFGNTLNVYNESLSTEIADAYALWMDWYATFSDIGDAVDDYREQVKREAA